MGAVLGLAGLFGGGLFGGAAGGLFAGIFSKLITNVLLGVINSLFGAKPPSLSIGLKDRGLTTMVREPITEREIVYGKVKKSGPIIYLSTAGSKNKYLHIVLALANHECEDIEEVWLNDVKMTWDKTTGKVTSGKHKDLAEFYFKLGASGQSAMQEIIDNTTDWTANHTLDGICYIYAKLTWDQSVYSNIPNISVVMKGKNDILDTRTSTTGYSTNAALCLLDYLRTDNLGLEITDTEYDATNVNTEANICDELVALAAGGNESRYTCNGVVDSKISLQQNLNELLSAMAGKLTYRSGKFYMYAGAYRTPTVEITNDDVIGDVNVNVLLSRAELFNGVKGVYISPDNEYQPSDFPAVKSEAFKVQDNNERIWRDIDLPYTDSAATAQRIAKILLLSTRQQITCSLTCKMKAFQVAIGDTVTVTDPDLGWSGKSFEVVEWLFGYDVQVGLNVSLVLRETAPSIYEWSSSEETEIDPAPDTDLPDLFTVATPTNLSLASGTDQLFSNGATLLSRIKATWDVADDEFVINGGIVEVQFKKSADEEWDPAPTGQIPGGNTEAFIFPVEDGVLYDVRVRFRNAQGVFGEWATSTNHTVVGKSEAPNTVQNFSANLVGSFVTFTWTSITDLDLAGYDIRYGPQGNTNWDDATPLVELQQGDNYTTSQIPPGSFVFFIRAVDSSGNRSTVSSTISLTVPQGNFSTDTQITLADTGWVGTLENMLIHLPTNSLVPDSLTPGDDAGDILDNPNVDFFATAKYTFDTIDLGSDKDIRVWADVTSNRISDTSGVADQILQIRTLSSAQSTTLLTLSETNVIKSDGTLTNMVLHHTGKLMPESQDLASVDGTMDEFVQNSHTSCNYISPEFDLGDDMVVSIIVETTENLGPGETLGSANVAVELDYRTAAGAYDGFESWTTQSVEARYFKVKLITDPAEGKTVINSASLEIDNFIPFGGLGDYSSIRFVQLRIKIDTSRGITNITDYTVTVDTAI